MIPYELRFYSHVAPFLLLFLIFFLTRPLLATAQEISGDFFPSSSFEMSGEISGTVYLDKGDLPVGQVTITIRSLSLWELLAAFCPI